MAVDECGVTGQQEGASVRTVVLAEIRTGHLHASYKRKICNRSIGRDRRSVGAFANSVMKC
jgi:hypothetical protein